MATQDTRGGDRHKGPKIKAVRIEDELWEDFKARAIADGYGDENGKGALTEALDDLLNWYVSRPARERRLR